MAKIKTPFDSRALILSVLFVSASCLVCDERILPVSVFAAFIFMFLLRRKVFNLFKILSPLFVLCVFFIVFKSFSDFSLNFSFASFREALVLSVRIISSAIPGISIFLYCDTPSLCSGVSSILRPVPLLRLLGIDLVISLGFMQLPFLFQRFSECLRSIKSRGGGSSFRIKMLKPVTLSISYAAIMRSRDLSLALDSRSFTGDFHYKKSPVKIPDIIVVLLSFFLLGLSIFVRFYGKDFFTI